MLRADPALEFQRGRQLALRRGEVAREDREALDLLEARALAVDVVDHFKKNNVLVSGPISGFDKHIRVSLGTRAEMQEFWRVWDLLPHKMSM